MVISDIVFTTRKKRKKKKQYNSMSSICLALIKSSWLTREFVCLSYRRTLTGVWMVCFVVENRDIVKQNVSILGSCHHHNSWIVTVITENMSLQYQILLFRGKKQSLAFFDLGFLCWISFADHTDVKYGSLALCSPSLYTCKIRAIVEKRANPIKEMYVTLHALL